MSYEVDILAVGENSHSGDAIALRFGNFTQNSKDQKVVVIDGGFRDSGEELVRRIQNEYGTNRVDLVVLTHPDNDHVSGLHEVLENLEVVELWMHRPWNTNQSVRKMAEDRSLNALVPASKLKKSLESAYDLEKLAIRKNIPIKEPFQGMTAFDGVLHVLGPNQGLYNELVTEFEKSATVFSLEKIKRLISEVWHQDELAEPEDGAVSARNNSSVVLFAELGDNHFIFTGDAGVIALNQAADYAIAKNYNIAQQAHFVQIPHHGSKRNVGPSVLDRIIGPIVQQGFQNGKTAFISAAADGNPKHPSSRVTNALNRRGVTVTATRGANHCFRSLDVPTRPGWDAIIPVAFLNSFEEEE